MYQLSNLELLNINGGAIIQAPLLGNATNVVMFIFNLARRIFNRN